jgi:hypothetical protein
MTAHKAAPRVLVPRSAVRSRAGRAIGWIALPWAIGFAIVVDVLLTSAGWPRTPRPLLLQVAILLVGAGPAVLWLLAGWLGHRRRLAWLLEWPQPKLILDTDGLTLATADQAPQRLLWTDIIAIRLLPPWVPSKIYGHGGAMLAEIPAPLVRPRVEGDGETRLADELAAFSPRLAGVTSAGRSDRLAVAVVLVVLLGLGAFGLIVLVTR